ncbi:MAG TPA: hypothetical protein VK582_10000 [Pyrinomonadaceae bacterium]|nr:hypothetical protein [Pyrinomonadaceae bacterium]
MNHLRFAALSVLLLCALANAQTSAPAQKKTTATPPAQKEVDPEFLQRRSLAMSLLQSLAIEARSYRDEPLRARVQARIADALWDEDKENARSLFRRAWEVAEVVEKDAAQDAVNAVPGRLAASRPARPRTNLRREILQLAARRDPALGEQFLAKLTAKDEALRTSDPATNRPEVSAAEMAERLRLANLFLASDNVERALQFADPALVRATTGSIQFLSTLRDKSPVAADQRFAALLSMALVDPASDANTVSLFTSYAFTPSIYLAVSPGGIPSSFSTLPRPAPDLPPALRQSFFSVAANILLRPFAQLDQSSAGRAGTYFIAMRLLPLFQQFAPDLASAISAQLAALGPEASRGTAEAGASSVNRGMSGDGRREGIDDELRDRLDRAQGADARDRAYAFAAMRAADEGDARARDLVDKIEDRDTRDGVRTFVNYKYIGTLITKKRIDEALLLARKADLPHTLRTHFITQAAAIVAKDDRGRAMELLGEALTEARRIDAGTAERAYCLVALLAQFAKLDKARDWELLSEAVKAANAVADFTGENGHTSVNLEGKFSIRMGTELVTPTTLPDVFASLAEENFYQAVDAGKTFTGDGPRALVTISIARAALESKPAKATGRGK